jgi:ADP-ribose diphosphatase
MPQRHAAPQRCAQKTGRHHCRGPGAPSRLLGVNDDDVKIAKRETVYQGFSRLDRYRLRHRLYNGGWSEEMEREVFERHHTVGVLLYDPQRDEVVLVEQFRLPARLAGFPAWELEIVAGIVDHDSETAEDLARREAREEAGIEIIGEPVLAHRFMPSPGACTERVELFCGRVNAEGAGGIHGLAHEHEDIKVVVLSYRAAMKLVRGDRIGNGLTVLALYWLAAHRARLRQSWR